MPFTSDVVKFFVKTVNYLQLLLLFSLASSSYAIDSIAIEGDITGNNSVNVARIGLSWDWDRKWPLADHWSLVGYWEFDIGHWDSSKSAPGMRGTLTEAGISPVIRIIRNETEGIRPWFEAGWGVHWITVTEIAGRDLSSHYQFGSHYGVGLSFGEHNEYDLGYRYQHLSNGNTRGANNGIELHLFHLGYHFN
jgi:hypothetical protein